MNPSDIYVVAAKRTPLGAFQGELRTLTAVNLAASAIRATLDQSGLGAADIDEAIIGCVLPAGLGQAPARQAVLEAQLDKTTPSSTLNKVCGSGLKAVMLGHDLIRAGSATTVLAGGMESMSNAPYLLPKARDGYRMGHQEVFDHMFYDGLQSPYDGQMMGHFAEMTAKRYEFSRGAQDDFAIASVSRAQDAAGSGRFDDELTPVTITSRQGERTIDADEVPQKADIERIPTLRPAFAKDGTVTAASSSSIADGAATLLLMSGEEVQERGVTPLARILGHSGFAQEPEWFTTAPIGAIRALLNQLSASASDIDCYEINEAFAVVTMAAMHDLGLDHDRVNVNGGACALGHPIGASGARIVVTLLHELARRESEHGLATLCVSGGLGFAMAFHRTGL